MALLEWLVTPEAAQVWAKNGNLTMVTGAVDAAAPPVVKDLWSKVKAAPTSLPWIETALRSRDADGPATPPPPLLVVHSHGHGDHTAGTSALRNRPNTRVVDPTRLKAQLQIAETQIRDVVIGQKAEIDTRNGISRGRVVRIDPAVVFAR